jgi:hypothetical protein
MKCFDKNLLWNGFNLEKRELYVKKKDQCGLQEAWS